MDEDFDPRAHVGESVTFCGTARTAAGGAIVSVAGEPIYVAGLRTWDSELEGRTVEVTGALRLREATVPPPRPGEPPRHGLPGATLVLDDARWAPAD